MTCETAKCREQGTKGSREKIHVGMGTSWRQRAWSFNGCYSLRKWTYQFWDCCCHSFMVFGSEVCLGVEHIQTSSCLFNCRWNVAMLKLYPLRVCKNDVPPKCYIISLPNMFFEMHSLILGCPRLSQPSVAKHGESDVPVEGCILYAKPTI